MNIDPERFFWRFCSGPRACIMRSGIAPNALIFALGYFTLFIGQALNVRRQGCYEWRARQSERPVRYRQDEVLEAKIQNIFYESKRRYGARKIVRLLRRDGRIVSRKRVRRLMLAAGLTPTTFRRHTATTDSKHDLGVFPNLLRRKFTAQAG